MKSSPSCKKKAGRKQAANPSAQMILLPIIFNAAHNRKGRRANGVCLCRPAQKEILKMKFGAVFPQTEIGSDPIAIRDYAQTVEGLGYDHILAFDHVLGAGTGTRPDWKGAYSAKNPFHEIFVLFGYLAG